MAPALALVRTWLLLDFFGESRRTGGAGSTLTTAIFGQSFLALVMAALLYPDVPPVAFSAANLSLSTLLLGIGTLGGEGGQRRREADRMLLGTAPIGPGVVAMARALHGAFHVCLRTIGMALPPAILLGFLLRDPVRAALHVPCACLLAGLMVGGLTLLLQVLRNVAGAARAALLAGTAKAVLLALGVIAFATCLPALGKGADALPIGRAGAELIPTYHAARFLAAPADEWHRGLLLLGLGAGLLLLSTLVRDREPTRARRAGRSLLMVVHSARLRGGPLLGMTEFVATMLYRSPGLRGRVLPLLGVPAALVLLSLSDSDTGAQQLFLAMALQFPAIYLPFLVAFLPRADHPGASWVFPSSPGASLETARKAAFLALVSHVLAPLHAIALLAMLALGVEWSFAVPVSLFASGLASLAARGQAAALPELPFTRAEDDEATGGDPGQAFGLALVLALMGAAFALSPTALRWILGVGAATAGLLQMARTR
jgi:hypothetical protein